MVQPVKAAPYFAHAQFATPETILALPDPGDAIPYVKAMWLYARGVALAANAISRRRRRRPTRSRSWSAPGLQAAEESASRRRRCFVSRAR